MIDDGNGGSRFRVRKKPIEKNIQNPFASTAIGSDTGRMEDLGSEIPAEEAPEWAVSGGADIVLIAGDDFADCKRRWTVGEEGAVEDKGFMRNRAIGDEDGGAAADTESDDGAVFGDETMEERFNLERRSAKPEEICDDGN